MSSQRQIDANRRNAQFSTGPKTPEGKATVSRNRTTHGLRSRDPVLPEEDPAEFNDLLAGFLDRFQPNDAFEESLVRQLASAEWRLRRIVRLETGIFIGRTDYIRENTRHAPAAPAREGTPDEHLYDRNTEMLGRAFQANCGGEVFVKLMRYENSIRRSFFKALDQLNNRRPGDHSNPIPPATPSGHDSIDQSEPRPSGSATTDPLAPASARPPQNTPASRPSAIPASPYFAGLSTFMSDGSRNSSSVRPLLISTDSA